MKIKDIISGQCFTSSVMGNTMADCEHGKFMRIQFGGKYNLMKEGWHVVDGFVCMSCGVFWNIFEDIDDCAIIGLHNE